MRLLRPSLVHSRPSLCLFMVLAFILVPLLTMSTLWVMQRASGRDNGQVADNWPFLPSGGVLDLQGKIVELREAIAHSETLNSDRKQEILNLRAQLQSVQSSNGSKLNFANPVNDLASLPTSLLHLPSLSSFLPNLLPDRTSLNPAYRRVSKNSPRTEATIVFGVPTVQRSVQSYLMVTLTDLISNLSAKEMKEVVIVIFIAETNGTYIEEQMSKIEAKFYEHIESGLLEIIAPPASFYPPLTSTSVKVTLNDPINRVIWRTKQNLDFAYLMMYCQPKGTFYVQLEDDVISKSGYVSDMKTFADKSSSDSKDWFMIEFCSLGFIGKMFQSRDLAALALWFVIFRNDKPCDWLLIDIATTKYCAIGDDNKKCKADIAKHWLKAPSLFQHIGTFSSLKGKVQKLKDKEFDKDKD